MAQPGQMVERRPARLRSLSPAAGADHGGRNRNVTVSQSLDQSYAYRNKLQHLF